MKGKIQRLQLLTGGLILLGGLLTYGLGVHELLPVPRPDLVVAGTSLIGTALILIGACDFFGEVPKEVEIEQKDERNIAIARLAGATAFQVMSVLFATALCVLVFTGYMNEVSCFTLIGVYLVSQVFYAVQLFRLQRKM